MAPKKAPGAAPTKKAAAAPSHPSYKDMIKEAILALKERNGSSRQAVKKYIQANNTISAASPAVFDQQFNKALRTGVEKGDFSQPKGASGPVKLAKKEPAKKAAAPAGVKKTATKAKKPAAKKATGDKAAKPKAAKPATKKAPAAKKAATPKANTSTKRKSKAAAPASAPAVVDVPKVISKTKSGRVTKTPAKAATAKKPAAKKATAKKPAAKEAPKKAAAPAPAAAS